jgi:hypothetical protein
MRPKIGQRVEVDLFGLRVSGSGLDGGTVAAGTIVALAPGSITVRLDAHAETEVTVGPARLMLRV